jgi:hypothetical protein
VEGVVTLQLKLHAIPPVIADSIRAVLTAHGYVVCATPFGHARPNVVRALTAAELDALVREMGNNTAQALVSIDESGPDVDVDAVDSDQPVSVYLPSKLVDAIERAAEARGTTTEQLVDEVINAALDREAK